jgi:hypothetical protein
MPVHYNTPDLNPNPVSQGIGVTAGPELARKNQVRADTYNQAARAWNASAEVPSFANFLNNIGPLGLSMEPPDIKRPATFSGGDYHLGWNPASLAGLAGLAGPPGLGTLIGSAAQSAYNAFGGKNLVLGGEGDMGMSTWGGQGSPSLSSGGGAATPGGGQLSEGNSESSLGSLVNPAPTPTPTSTQTAGVGASVQPGGPSTAVQGPTNLAQLLAMLKQSAPPGLGQHVGVI